MGITSTVIFVATLVTLTALSRPLAKWLRLPAGALQIGLGFAARGAVTLALALSLPVSLDYWWTIQSMAFGVVLFGVLIQAPTLMFFIRRDVPEGNPG